MGTLNSKQINTVCELLSKEYPDAGCELSYDSTYHLLVAVMLSAQTTDKGVNRVTPLLFERAKTPEDMVRLGASELESIIKSIGLYKNKAKNIIAMSQMLISDFDGKVPENYDDLISLPGVGRKTANVVSAEAFGIPCIAVDTHVFRLANRIGITNEKDVLHTEEALIRVIPENRRINMHHLLIWHGRRCCTAKNPSCERCCIKEICQSSANCIEK